MYTPAECLPDMQAGVDYCTEGAPLRRGSIRLRDEMSFSRGTCHWSLTRQEDSRVRGARAGDRLVPEPAMQA